MREPIKAVLCVVAFCAVMVLSVLFATGHDTEIVQCERNLRVSAVDKLEEVINENGTVSELYDRNQDGEADIEAVSYLVAIEEHDGDVTYLHRPHPFLYIVDLDFDGNSDIVYVDKFGEGRCDDIVPYQDLHLSPYNEHGGKTL